MSFAIPVKYADNPLDFKGIPGSWDANIDYAKVLKVGNRTHIWYDCWNNTDHINQGVAYAYFDLDEILVKPVLYKFAFGGSSANNLIMEAQSYGLDVYHNDPAAANYDPTAPAYVGMLAAKMVTGTVTAGMFLYDSPDGVVWTYRSTITTGLKAGYAITRIGNQWCAYYQIGGVSENRSIAVYTTATWGGAWVDQGIVISYSSTELQRYMLRFFVLDGVTYAAVATYNYTTDRMPYFELYRTTDGIEFTLVNAQWIAAGDTAGDWDYGIMIASGVAQIGSELRFYYTGRASGHLPVIPWYGNIGYAVISDTASGTLFKGLDGSSYPVFTLSGAAVTIVNI